LPFGLFSVKQIPGIFIKRCTNLPLQKLAEIYPNIPMGVKLAVLAVPLLPNLWCIFQATTRNFINPMERRVWLLLGMFLPVLGGLAYLFWGRKRVARD
jgi:hypothetical protein